MYVTKIFLVKILLLYCLFQTAAARTGNSYGKACVCTGVSSSDSQFCWAFKCRRNQVIKCFTNDSTVEIISTKLNEHKSIKDLEIDGQVLVDIEKQSHCIYEPIYSFIHTSRNKVYDYLEIFLENDLKQSVIIPRNYLIYRFNETNPVFVGHLKIGDQLQIINKNGSIRANFIEDIESIKSQDLEEPLIDSRELVEDEDKTVDDHQLPRSTTSFYKNWFRWIKSSSYFEYIQWYWEWLYDIVLEVHNWFYYIGLYDGYFLISIIAILQVLYYVY